jgi:hypothetical protein
VKICLEKRKGQKNFRREVWKGKSNKKGENLFLAGVRASLCYEFHTVRSEDAENC